MHFRERGRVVQVIRTTYDASTKKGRPQIVARLERQKPRVTPEMRQACTPEELVEIKVWIEQQQGDASLVAAAPAGRPARVAARRAARAARGGAKAIGGAGRKAAPGADAAAAAEIALLPARIEQAVAWFLSPEGAQDQRRAMAVSRKLRRLQRTLIRLKLVERPAAVRKSRAAT